MTRPFEVQAGSDTTEDIPMNVGRITIHAVDTAGAQPLSNTHWRLFSVKPDGSDGAGAAQDDYRRNLSVTLGAGSYRALVVLDGGRKGELRFDVKTGEQTEHEIVVPP
jgi:hypothetical protein